MILSPPVGIVRGQKGVNMYVVVWDNGKDASDSVGEYTDLDIAKETAYDILNGWMESAADADDEEWNSMIENAYAYVAEYDPTTEDYPPVWEPSDDELEDIGWVKRGEE